MAGVGTDPELMGNPRDRAVATALGGRHVEDDPAEFEREVDDADVEPLALSELLEAIRAGDASEPVGSRWHSSSTRCSSSRRPTAIGARRYERTDERLTHRNGSRTRVLSTDPATPRQHIRGPGRLHGYVEPRFHRWRWCSSRPTPTLPRYRLPVQLLEEIRSANPLEGVNEHQSGGRNANRNLPLRGGPTTALREAALPIRLRQAKIGPQFQGLFLHVF